MPTLFGFLLFLLGSAIIWWSLRTGEIAAGGGTIEREKNPILFWAAVGLVAIASAGLAVLGVTL